MDVLNNLKEYLNSISSEKLSSWEQPENFAHEFYSHLHQIGAMTYAIPTTKNPSVMKMRDIIDLAHEIAWHSPGLFSGWIGNLLGVTAVVEFAHEPLKKNVLDKYTKSKKLMSFCFTEPDAGTDIGKLTTTYQKTNSGYVLNGKKHLITNIGHAEHYIVFARHIDSPAGKPLVSAFYVSSQHRGVDLGHCFDKLGHKESNTGTIIFNNVQLSDNSLLASEGSGTEILGRCISRTKTLIGAASVATSRKSHKLATDYLTNRVLYGEPLIKRADIRAQLAELYIKSEAAWQLTINAGEAWDNGNAIKEASMAKFFAAKVAVEYVSTGLELCGGHGYMNNHPFSKLYRDVKLFDIYEGASLVQLAIVSREIFKTKKPIINGVTAKAA